MSAGLAISVNDGSNHVVNRAPGSDANHLNQPLVSYEMIDDAERANAVFPQPFQFPLQRLAGAWIFTENSKGLLGITLDGRR